MSSIRNVVRINREKEIVDQVAELESLLSKENWVITYGTIGKRTTYVLLARDDEEIVGYTFIRNLEFYNKDVGKLKALQQAIARKELAENSEELL